uniref:(northern house mosquito) hypothetical protein n=2 Tax=Culex pipiens TaxID=7175 RepID=A0A8D8CPS2_CULPI
MRSSHAAVSSLDIISTKIHLTKINRKLTNCQCFAAASLVLPHGIIRGVGSVRRFRVHGTSDELFRVTVTNVDNLEVGTAEGECLLVIQSSFFKCRTKLTADSIQEFNPRVNKLNNYLRCARTQPPYLTINCSKRPE